MACSHVKDHTTFFPTGRWFYNGREGAELTWKFLCFGGYKICSWVDSSGRAKEKEIVCGRAELLFYFCLLPSMAVSELHEQMFFIKLNKQNCEHLNTWGGEQTGGHLLEPSAAFSL